MYNKAPLSISPIHSLANNALSLDQATKRIKKWKDDHGNEVKTKAFFINLSDLIALIKEVLLSDVSAVGIRAYLAKNEENGDQAELLLVAAELDIDSSNADIPAMLTVRDVLLPPPAKPTDPNLIYDLTTPCPNMCDLTSPLYQASIDTLVKTKKSLKKLAGSAKSSGKKDKK